jgi:enterochelin esterase-like enzyme
MVRWSSWYARAAVVSALACPPCAAAASGPVEGFEALLARLATDAGGPDPSSTEADIERLGPPPLVQGADAVFLAEGDAASPPRILGDFNGWGEAAADPEATGAMARVPGTRWYWLRVRLDPAARIEYTIVRAGREGPDPRNPRRLDCFGEPCSELVMPRWSGEAEAAPDPAHPRGRVVRTTFESRALGNRRALHVYLPPGYAESDDRYPTAYFGDGTTYVDGVRVPEVLDRVIATGRVRPLVAVFVDPVVRREEYVGHEGYRRLIAEELVPAIDRDYRTDARPAARAILGGSRGGLAAADMALARPDVFGLCAPLSPAISPADLEARIAGGPLRPLRFFVVAGTYDREWLPDGRRLRDALRARGYDVRYGEFPEGHSLKAWRAQIDDALEAFFPASAR